MYVGKVSNWMWVLVLITPISYHLGLSFLISKIRGLNYIEVLCTRCIRLGGKWMSILIIVHLF